MTAHPTASGPGTALTRSSISHFKGCLIGGAVGDALGAPIEFLSWPQIVKQFGARGLVDPVAADAHRITDDTQMTMFTAEGLIRANVRYIGKGLASVPNVVYHAYLRWLKTQSETSPAMAEWRKGTRGPWPDGWLASIQELHSRRGPGNTCLSALKSGQVGSIDSPLNDSKGCGGVMRIAPVGLAASAERVFDLGCDIAALTHGHPSGFLAAGYVAALLQMIRDGLELDEAVRQARLVLHARPGSAECVAAIDAAVALAKSDPPGVDAVESLGQGWVAEEAVAIALYACLTARDFASGVVVAVNHGGDSDSTGAIAGNILGLLWGLDSIPVEWRHGLELQAEIEELATDLHRHFAEVEPQPPIEVELAGTEFSQVAPGEWFKYPGW